MRSIYLIDSLVDYYAYNLKRKSNSNQNYIIFQTFQLRWKKVAISKFLLDVSGGIVGMGGGLVAPAITLDYLKGHWPFQSPIEWALRCVCVYGWGIHALITPNLKKCARSSHYQSSVPPLKFGRSPFLYIPHMLQDTGFNPCPEGCEGLSSSKTQFQDLSIALNKMAISKFLLDVFGEMVGMGWG